MEVRNARETLRLISAEPIRAEARQVLDSMRLRDDQWRKEKAEDRTYCGPKFPPFQPTYYQVVQQFETRKSAIPDPTTLILIDEADRLGMNSLEQVRSIFDESDVGLILIGMPGIEKRMARLPQFYSRIGFVHEFRPLGTAEVQSLLESGWAPSGIALPLDPFKPDVLGAIIRMTGGNFRLLNRLLTQIERLLKLNEAQTATLEIVDAARESLVIGQA
jgi:DNA transposition AAA+ family ATPase